MHVRPGLAGTFAARWGRASCPALAVVIVGEVARIRSWLYYIIGGGLALAAIPLLSRINSSGVGTLSDATVWQVFATQALRGASCIGSSPAAMLEPHWRS